jgi:Flp pilus assembly protein TadD
MRNTTSLKRPPGRRFSIPAVLGLGLLTAACASAGDPYAGAVARGTSGDELGEVQPNAQAAAALLRVATATRAAGDYASAINVLKRALRLAPSDSEIFAELGESLAAVRAYDEAREIFTRAVTIAPADTRILRGLANVLVAQSEPALAIVRYREALAVRKEAATYNGLGVALDILNNGVEAEAAYREGLALDARNQSLIGNLALSLSLRARHQDAIDLIAGELRANRSTPRLRQNLALIYGLAGRLSDARTILRIDMDERSVANNLGYYEMLAGLQAQSRRDTVLGRRAVVVPQNVVEALTAPAEKPAAEKDGSSADKPERLPATPLPNVSPAPEGATP